MRSAAPVGRAPVARHAPPVRARGPAARVRRALAAAGTVAALLRVPAAAEAPPFPRPGAATPVRAAGSDAPAPRPTAPPLAAAEYDAAAARARTLLDALVAADTSNPPGHEARAVALGAARLRAAGIEPEITTFAPGRENLVARLPGHASRAGLLLLAHTDVVGAAGQTWTTDPHRVTEVDGFLVGRGVADDLGMAAAALETFLLVHASGVPLARDLVLAWTGDEESGGAGIRWLLAHRRASLEAAVALNEGGAVVLGADGRPAYVSLQTAEKTYQDYVVTARGPTGHSSVPLADNAIYRLARALDRLGRHRFPARLLPVTRAHLAARAATEPPERAAAMRAVAAAAGALPAGALAVLDADPVLAATLRTTCVATLVQGGSRQNALPAEATATVNCRLLPDETPAAVEAELRRVLDDPALELRATDEFGHATPSPLDGPAPDAIRRAVAAMWPGVPVVPFMSRGASDSRFLRAAGIPAYGLLPLPMTEADARRAHGVDERIPAGSLRPAIELLHRVALAVAGPDTASAPPAAP